MISSVADLLNPLSVSEFKDKYWRKLPIYIPGEPSKLQDLLPRKAFWELAEQPDVELFAAEIFDASVHRRSRKNMVNFQQIPVTSYQAQKLFKHGFTIQVEDAHFGSEKIFEILTGLREELGIYAAMAGGAFLSSPGEGYGTHIDPHPDTWILQISGTKRWTYAPEPAVTYPLQLSAVPHDGSKPPADPWSNLERPDTSGHIVVDISPGDVFYFPGGVWHSTQTIGDEESCHIVLGSINDTFADLFFDVLRPKLLADVNWRAVGHDTPVHDDAMKAVMASRLEELKAAVADLTVEDIAAGLDKGLKQRARGSYRQSSRTPRQEAATLVYEP